MRTVTQAVTGVLPAPAAISQKKDSNPQTAKNAVQQKLKLVLRRLAPGLTQAEFEAALGQEWRVGAGKVGWFIFKPGKISKDLSKPSRPTRAYIQLAHQSDLQALQIKVRNTTFSDAKNTSKDLALVGPPVLEVAPYARVPVGRRKPDARQGLIDQDAEFQLFLESLTSPPIKPDNHSADGADKKQVTTTPLIEHIRDKKAAKEKAAKEKAERSKNAKNKRDDAKDSKVEKAVDRKPEKKATRPVAADTATAERSKKPGRAEKAAKETVKVLDKEVPAASAERSATLAQSTKSPSKPRQRGSGALAAQILQRDLGIGPGANAPRRKRGAPSGDIKTTPSVVAAAVNGTALGETEPKSAPTASTSASAKSEKKSLPERKGKKGPEQGDVASTMNETATQPVSPVLLKKPPTGPAAQQKRSQGAQGMATAGGSTSIKATNDPNPSSPTLFTAPKARNAFLKHANLSQGITETLIKEALGAFGNVQTVEIDKRKGFAYATFETPDGLRAAMRASPVKVAQGAVVVLERREVKTAAQAAQGQGRGQVGGRGAPNARANKMAPKRKESIGSGSVTASEVSGSTPRVTESKPVSAKTEPP